MAAPWSITNTSAGGAAATANVAAPTSATTTNQVTRLRAIQATLAGTTAGQDTLQVLDGVAVIFAARMSVPANGSDNIQLSDLDLRASPGSTLTVAFTSGVGSDIETVNAQGDFIPVGLPYGSNSP